MTVTMMNLTNLIPSGSFRLILKLNVRKILIFCLKLNTLTSFFFFYSTGAYLVQRRFLLGNGMAVWEN